MGTTEQAGPLITVAVPTYNGGRHLRATLSSIRSSTTAHHFLIVDDRSIDDTLEIARALVGDQARVEINSERLGLAANWNRCVALSHSPLVAIFHQDDIMLPGHLGAHVQTYQANPSIGWVASNAGVIDDQGNPVPSSVVDRGGLGDRDRAFAVGAAVGVLAIGNPLRCSGVTISAAAHAEVGGFDPSYRYVVDWDYWLKVAKVRPVAWRAEPTVAIRWHPSSETHRFANGTLDLDETARLLDQLVFEIGPDHVEMQSWRRRADRRLARAFLNRAHVAFKQGDPNLARRALIRSLRLAPTPILKALLGDPRLCAQMTAVILTPRWIERSTGGSPG